jgi:hypothetical protein
MSLMGYTQLMVRISPERIKELQKLLKEQTGKDYTDEEAQEAGLAIMRFVIVKEQRRQELGEQQNEKTKHA